MEQYRQRVLTVLILSSMIVGCANDKAAAPKIEKRVEKQQQKESVVSLSSLKEASFGTISLVGAKAYKEQQPISFHIDTKKQTGYLYIVYVGNKGETALLYPNADSPLSELNGDYDFPQDFGGMKIRATKDCKDCKKEKTTVYAILSK